jgi:hypothetical protein
LINFQTKIAGGLCPVAGPAGDRLPRIRINVIDILFDQKDFAARRAAEGNRFSADAEFDFFAADLALHKKPRIYHRDRSAWRKAKIFEQ